MRSWKPLERFRDVFLFFTFAATFLLSACLPQEEVGDNAEDSPGAEQPLPNQPGVESPSLLSKPLVDFVLKSSDAPDCQEKKVYLIKSDGSREEKSNIQEAIDESVEGEKIEIGKGDFSESLKVINKSSLEIKSSCKPQVKSISFKKSSQVHISGIRVNSQSSWKSAIKFHGGGNSSESITLSKVEVSESGKWRSGVSIGSDNTNIILDTVYIHDNGGNAVTAGENSTYKIKNSFIASNTRMGVETRKASKGKIVNSTILDSGTRRTWYIGGYGIYHRGLPEDIQLIDSRIIYNNGSKRPGSSRDIAKVSRVFDSEDSGNFTTLGGEAPGVHKFEDMINPIISVGIEDNITTDSPVFRVPILTQDTSPVKTRVLLNGIEVAYSERHAFEPRIALQPGLNKIEIKASDNSGNNSEVVVRSIVFSSDVVEAPVARCNENEIYILDKDNIERTASSLQSAINQVKDNEKIFVGKYDSHKRLYISTNKNFSLTSFCRAKIGSLAFYRSGNVTIDGFIVDPGGRRSSIYVNGHRTGNITIMNTEVRNSGWYGLYLGRSHKNLRLVNTYFHDNRRDALRLKSGASVSIENSVIIDNDGDGVDVSPGLKVHFENNKIVSNGNGYHRGYGIALSGWKWLHKPGDITLVGNTIYSNNGRAHRHWRWRWGGWRRWHRWHDNSGDDGDGEDSNGEAGDSTPGHSMDVEYYQIVFDSKDVGNKTTEGIESVNTVALSDDLAPEIITTMAQNSGSNSSPIAFSFSVKDDSPVQSIVKVNGEEVADSHLISSLLAIDLGEGGNSIEVVSTDYFGNSSTFNFNVSLDKDKPQLVAFIPADGATVFSNDKSVNVSLESNENLLSATVNGSSLSIFGKTASGVVVFPDIGTNTLDISIKDLAGNTSNFQQSINIVNEMDPPVISVDVVDNLITRDQQLPISIQITDQSSISTEVVLNGAVITESTNSSINLNLALVSGENELDITSVDGAGNSASLSRRIVSDNIAPDFLSVVPAEDSVLETRKPSIVATYSDSITGIDAAKSKVIINGIDKSPEFSFNDSSATSVLTSDLAIGLNTIQFTIYDLAGNSAQFTRKLNLGITPPVLSITPVNDQVIDKKKITITLNYSGPELDLNTVFLSLNGVDLSSQLIKDSDGATLLSSPDLQPGSNQIVGRILNRFNQLTEISSSVIFQPPTIVTGQPGENGPPTTESSGSVDLNNALIVAIEDPTSPIFGAMTVIPQAAVPGDDLQVNIRLASNSEVPFLESELTQPGDLGPVVQFESSEPLQSQVIVGIPFDRDAVLRQNIPKDELVLIRAQKNPDRFEIVEPYLVDMEKGLMFAGVEGFSWWFGGRRRRSPWSCSRSTLRQGNGFPYERYEYDSTCEHKQTGEVCVTTIRERFGVTLVNTRVCSFPSTYDGKPAYLSMDVDTPSNCVSNIFSKSCEVESTAAGGRPYEIAGTISSNLFAANEPEFTCIVCPGTPEIRFEDIDGQTKEFYITGDLPADVGQVLFEIKADRKTVSARYNFRVVPPIPPQPTDPPPVLACGQSGVMCNFLGNNIAGRSPDGSQANTSSIFIGDSFVKVRDFEIDAAGDFVWLEPREAEVTRNLPLLLRKVNDQGLIETIGTVFLDTLVGTTQGGEVLDLEYGLFPNRDGYYIALEGEEMKSDGSVVKTFTLKVFDTIVQQRARTIFRKESEYLRNIAVAPNAVVYYYANDNPVLRGNLYVYNGDGRDRERAITFFALASPPDKISPDGTIVTDFEVDFISDLKYYNGELYFIQKNANCIRKFDDQWILHTVAGICDISIAPEGEDVAAQTARFGRLTTFEIDNNGNMFVYEDFPFRRYRVIRADTGTVQTVVGGGSTPLDFDSFPSKAREISIPTVAELPHIGAFTVDNEGNLYGLGGNFVYKVTDVISDFIVPREPSSDPTDRPTTTVTLTPVEINVDTIAEVLENSQHSDGYWDFEEKYLGEQQEDDSSRRLHATANTLDFLLENGLEDSQMAKDAVLWVANQDYASTPMLAKQLKVLTKYKNSAKLPTNVRRRVKEMLSRLILTFRPSFFGWGSDKFSVTNNYSTGLAIEVLSLAGKNYDPEIGELNLGQYATTLRRTTGNQFNRDIARAYFGGFGFYEKENPPVLLNTISMVRGLIEYKEINSSDFRVVSSREKPSFETLRDLVIPPVVNNATDFIIGSQRPDGSYGSVKETVDAMKAIQRIINSGLVTNAAKLARLQMSFDAAVAHLNTVDLSFFEMGSIANFTDHFSAGKSIQVVQGDEPEAEIDVNTLPSSELGDGSDGRLFANGVFNISENSSNGRTRPDGVDASVISIISSSTLEIGNSLEGDFVVGDEVALMSRQGSVSPGLIEFKKISFVDYSQSPARIGFDSDISTNFSSNDTLVVQRVPNYSSIDSPSSLVITANKWDGITGGSVLFRVAGEISNKVAIDVAGLGFRGGMGAPDGSSYTSTQGEGVLKSGDRSPSSLGSNDCGGGNGSAPQFAGGAGGYGTDGAPSSGFSFPANSGLSFGSSDLTKVFVGCGGGSGSASTVTSNGSVGGSGGGIVVIYANQMDLDGVNSYIRADGKSGKDGVGSNSPSYGAGGGSGGSILLSVIDAQVSSNSISAIGGSGSQGANNQAGHTGGFGRVRVNYRKINDQPFPSLGQGAASLNLAIPTAYAGDFQ